MKAKKLLLLWCAFALITSSMGFGANSAYDFKYLDKKVADYKKTMPVSRQAQVLSSFDANKKKPWYSRSLLKEYAPSFYAWLQRPDVQYYKGVTALSLAVMQIWFSDYSTSEEIVKMNPEQFKNFRERKNIFNNISAVAAVHSKIESGIALGVNGIYPTMRSWGINYAAGECAKVIVEPGKSMFGDFLYLAVNIGLSEGLSRLWNKAVEKIYGKPSLSEAKE